MSCGDSFVRSIDRSQVHNLSARVFELSGDLSVVTFEAFAQTLELAPISVQPGAEEADAMALDCFSKNRFHLHYRADSTFNSSPELMPEWGAVRPLRLRRT